MGLRNVNDCKRLAWSKGNSEKTGKVNKNTIERKGGRKEGRKERWNGGREKEKRNGQRECT